MQASSDIFLGWQRAKAGLDGEQRDFYVRQLRDWKYSINIEALLPQGLRIYGELCGWPLARAHARSGDRIGIAAYLGGSDVFDQAITRFAAAYADQNERDQQALVNAVGIRTDHRRTRHVRSLTDPGRQAATSWRESARPGPSCSGGVTCRHRHREGLGRSIPMPGCARRWGQDGGPGTAWPAGYSCMGTSPADHAFITGSMMRHASSASSPRMNSIGLLLSISRIRLA